jgi:hypothetical protein
MIIKMTRQGLLCGDFVKAFLNYISLFPVGSIVELSDNRVGKVVHANGMSYAKPVISVLTDSSGSPLPADNYTQLDLRNDVRLQVVKALTPDHVKGVGIMDGF